MIYLISPTPFISLIYRDANANSIVFTKNQTILSQQIMVHMLINEGYKHNMMYNHKPNRLFYTHFHTEYVGSGINRNSQIGLRSEVG